MATRNADYNYNNNGVWDKLNLSTIASQVGLGSTALHKTNFEKLLGLKRIGVVSNLETYRIDWNSTLPGRTSNTGELEQSASDPRAIVCKKTGLYQIEFSAVISNTNGNTAFCLLCYANDAAEQFGQSASVIESYHRETFSTVVYLEAGKKTETRILRYGGNPYQLSGAELTITPLILS